ncbi:hypothetical protein [Paraburkholderia sp. MM6662-R1]|uniref:hypothetical protein n=1 Tax=Paraburkholderia sp. MM6662-R1 TaxID=2991066 RepID=UPI003D24623A
MATHDTSESEMARLLEILEEGFDPGIPPGGRGSATFFYLFGMKAMLGYLSSMLGAENFDIIKGYHAQIDALRVSNKARYDPDVSRGGPPLS